MMKISVSILAGAVLLLGGCVSFTLPPSLSAAERMRLHDVLPLRVATDQVEQVESLGVFREVVARGTGAPVALIVESAIAGDQQVPIAVLPLVTLGLVPLISSEEVGRRLTFTRPDGTGDPVEVTYTYECTSAIGLLGTMLQLSPLTHTGEHPTGSDRFRAQLGHAVMQQRAALLSLAGVRERQAGRTPTKVDRRHHGR